MILQSLEWIKYKEASSKKRVGKHILVLTAFKDGLIFGAKCNEHLDKPGQWVIQILPDVVVTGIGDFADFQKVTMALETLRQATDNLIGEEYITGKGLINFLSPYLKNEFFEGARPLAVNLIVIHPEDEKNILLWFVDYDGQYRRLKNFGVAGGVDCDPPEKNRKEAIDYLAKNWKPDMNGEEATNLVKDSIFKCDEIKEEGIIEIRIFLWGKQHVLRYFKKE